MHLTTDDLERLLADELEPDRAREIERHLQHCTACVQSLDQARAEERMVFGALRALDAPAPSVDPDLVWRQARRGTTDRRPDFQGTADAHRAARGRWVWAAVLVGLLISAGLVYTAPNSPLRLWLASRFENGAPRRPPEAPGVSPETRAEDGSSGIVVTPGERYLVRFEAEQVSGRIRLSIVDRSDLSIRALAAGVSFVTDAQQLIVRNRGASGDYELQVPRDARELRVACGEQVLFETRGGSIDAAVPRDDTGRYLLPLHRGSPEGEAP